MFNFLKSKKSKQAELLNTQIFLWLTSCLDWVNKSLLNEPRPKVGAILFFIWSIDNISKIYSLSDESFAKLAIDSLETMWFPKEVTIPVFQNFYTNPSRNKFALQANIEWGKNVADFYANKNPLSVFVFWNLVREWAMKPELWKDDLFLLWI